MPRSRPREPTYLRIIREVFRLHYDDGAAHFDFGREEINDIARAIGVRIPKNLGDNIYAIRHGRTELPADIKKLAPKNKSWLLLPRAKGEYTFHAADRAFLVPAAEIIPTLIPDATPQILDRYLLNQEQSLLARIAYCRLIDIFLGVAAYRVQSHLRTTVARFGGSQIEIDDLYAATEQSGAHFIVPIQAKSKADGEKISCVQLICDYYWCLETFGAAIPRIIAAKVLNEQDGPIKVLTIALIEARIGEHYNVTIHREQHFKLVPSSMISDADLKRYRRAYQDALRP